MQPILLGNDELHVEVELFAEFFDLWVIIGRQEVGEVYAPLFGVAVNTSPT